VWDENNIDTPDVKKWKISKKVDDITIINILGKLKNMKSNIFALIKSGSNVWLNQESLKLIKGVENLVNLETTEEDILYLVEIWNKYIDELYVWNNEK